MTNVWCLCERHDCRNDIEMGLRNNKRPWCTIIHEGYKFIRHSLLPSAMMESKSMSNICSIDGGKRYLVTEKIFFGLQILAFPQVVMKWVSMKGVERDASIFDVMYKLMKLALVLSVTTVIIERVSSTIKYTMSQLCNNIGDRWPE